MHQCAEVSWSTELPETFQEAYALVAAIGRHLGGTETARRLVEPREIGERSPDVDTDDGPGGAAHSGTTTP
jgi:hypothetical protein